MGPPSNLRTRVSPPSTPAIPPNPHRACAEGVWLDAGDGGGEAEVYGDQPVRAMDRGTSRPSTGHLFLHESGRLEGFESGQKIMPSTHRPPSRQRLWKRAGLSPRTSFQRRTRWAWSANPYW